MLGRPVAWLSRLERGLAQAGPISAAEAAASAALPAEPVSPPGADIESAAGATGNWLSCLVIWCRSLRSQFALPPAISSPGCTS